MTAATCGHALPKELPDGSNAAAAQGHALILAEHARDGSPCAAHATYCGACRDAACAQPGFVLSTEEQTLAWVLGGR